MMVPFVQWLIGTNAPAYLSVQIPNKENINIYMN